MKRYMLFGYDQYYPMGGMSDFVDSFDTLDEVKKAIKDAQGKEYPCEYYDVYDLTDNIGITL